MVPRFLEFKASTTEPGPQVNALYILVINTILSPLINVYFEFDF